jgi:thiol-disulfide isomerase/thioredoxin
MTMKARSNNPLTTDTVKVAALAQTQTVHLAYGLLMGFIVLVWAILLLLKGLSLNAVANTTATTGTRLVIFTASWCAPCKTVVPGLQEVAIGLGLPSQVVDVDDAQAEDVSAQMGVALPSRSLPQAFYVQKAGSRLVFDGATNPNAPIESLKTGLKGAILRQ